tara:strand:- start:362 stop:550 length:189 start_codon:yes stop_codon:yes gene_type:complete
MGIIERGEKVSLYSQHGQTTRKKKKRKRRRIKRTGCSDGAEQQSRSRDSSQTCQIVDTGETR